MEIKEANMISFYENYNLKIPIKQPTCYKNFQKPTCIELILINVPRMFQSTSVLETGISDFHLMTVTVMRKTFKKMRPTVINYRSYRNFPNETFRVSLINNFSKEVFVNNDDGLEKFCKTTMDTLNSFSPIKTKYARGNQIPFMTKNLFKEIMTRWRLRNIYSKHKTEENYYGNLTEKDMTDKKKVWKTIKTFLTKFISMKMEK